MPYAPQTPAQGTANATAMGAAFSCTPAGVITGIIHDSATMLPGEGTPLEEVVDAGSAAKSHNFLDEVNREGAAFHWEMNVLQEGVPRTFHFAGALQEGRVFIIAARSFTEIFELYEEMVQINNEQVNLLRSAMKRHSLVPATEDIKTSRAPLAQSAPAPSQQGPQTEAQYDDISRLNNELINVQRELYKKNSQLEALNRQKNILLGMAAHDLRNPLGIIMLYSGHLLEKAAPHLSPGEREMLAVIEHSSHFMRSLVEDMLDVSRIESGRVRIAPIPTDVVELVTRNVALNRVMAEKRTITIHLDIDENLSARAPRLLVDGSKLNQVLNNLISNAVKYSPDGADVAVELGATYHADTDSSPNSDPNSGTNKQVDTPQWQTTLRVADTGQGIPDDKLETLFTPFVTAGAKAGGEEGATGLGLAIVKRIVEAHGGHIGVSSRVGVGSAFTVSLPLHEADDCETPETPSSSGAPDTSGAPAKKPGCEGVGLRILVAEDDALNQHVVRTMLSQMGAEVTIASNGTEAVQQASEGGWDIIFMDMRMPGMSGLEAARTIREAEQHSGTGRVPIVALTAQSFAEDREACTAAGMDDFVGKPFAMDDLRRVLGEYGA